MFTAIQPVLPARDVTVSLEFYVDKLGFDLAFVDDAQNPKYAGIVRDGIQLHLQCHQEENWKQMNACMLRFVIEDIDTLFKEYKPLGVFHEQTALRITPWHTQEFAFYDPDMNGLTFYKNL